VENFLSEQALPGFEDPPRKRLSRKTLFYHGLADRQIQMAGIPIAAFIPNYVMMLSVYKPLDEKAHTELRSKLAVARAE
jgi:hypothetical protein